MNDILLATTPAVIVLIAMLSVRFVEHYLQSKRETERQKLEKERQTREAISKFREQRARPIIEALDRATHRWDYGTHTELADMVGYEGESVDIQSEEFKQELRESRKKYFEQLQDDISAASTIHDDAIRKLVTQVLWASADPNLIIKEGSPTLKDAYLKLERWIFEP
jgi:hypothetical protein